MKATLQEMNRGSLSIHGEDCEEMSSDDDQVDDVTENVESDEDR